MNYLFDIEKYSCLFEDYFIEHGMNTILASILNIVLNLIILSLVIFLIDFIIRKFIIQAFKAFTNKTKNTFDDHLIRSNFPKFVAHFIPLFLVRFCIPIIFIEWAFISKLLLIITDIYLIILFALVSRSLLRTTKAHLKTKESFKDKPLDSYIQVLMIFIWGLVIVFILYTLTGQSLVSLTTFGAASAVILLIFKDTILGFVASIQISVNDIVRIGDWITVKKYGADGYVTEINLATVRVQNFDNTFTTIPTYTLISESFQNWRGMQESGGRRIKRSLFIKQNTVKFLSSEDIKKLKEITLIKPYIEHREKEFKSFNKKNDIDTNLPINGKNQTNLGVFRKYIDALLHENNAINKEMFLMVRHLAPTDKGIPLEVFCYSFDKAWENYEHIQADMFDHIIAAVSYFDLELFELPSGKDFSEIKL